MTIHYQGHGVTLHHGDCLDVLRSLPDCSVDSVVTDPPYGLEFMGKDWDGSDGFRRSLNAADAGRENAFGRASRTSPEYRAGHLFGDWCRLWATECLRVLKPGGYLISAGGSRTYHRMTSGVEDAGFEIRDCITWHFGSGFPKSLNVSAALAKIPACSCDVSGELGTVNAVTPARAVGAGVGAEARPVSLAGLPADAAGRVGPKVVTSGATGLGAQDVHALDADLGGHGLPVVLGSPGVAGAAEREQVVGGVRGVEVEPEALRDQVMGEKPVDGSAVGAGAVAGDDVSCNVGPASAFVLPLSATPSGVPLAVESGPIVGGHTGSGAVGRGVSPAPELDTADGADVDTVSSASHGRNSTAERLARCEDCGGLRGEIPQGLGTALKPATEFFVVARKPLVGTVSANVLAHGTGALNVDGCRIGDGGGTTKGNPPKGESNGIYGNGINGACDIVDLGKGRWPANVVLDESQAAALDEQSGESRDGTAVKRNRSEDGRAPYEASSYMITDRSREDQTYGGQGGASRFFYVAKADASERPRVNGTAHPTVKPLALMRWLVRLVTPPGGTVLEPFAGSGTTVEACIVEGFQCIAIEREADYLPLIRQRIDRRRDPVEALRGQAADLGLFDLLGGEGA